MPLAAGLARLARAAFATSLAAACLGGLGGLGCSADAGGDGGDPGADPAGDSEALSTWAHPAYADYGGVLRRPDGHVDTQTMIARLKALHATSYAFLIWGWRYQAKPYYDTDFDDLSREFVPAAEAAGIDVWAYLPSPTEMASYAPPPCKADFVCWGDKIGALAAAHPNVKAIVIDDFFSKPNIAKLTPDVSRQVRAAARSHGAPVELMPVAYFTNTMHGMLQYNYSGAFDGLVFVNLNRSIADTATYLPDELSQMNRVAKSEVWALNMHVPASGAASVGEAATLSQEVDVGAGPHVLHFAEGDNLFGDAGQPAVAGANGARMLQVVVNGNKVWERDLNLPPPASDTPGFARRTVDLGDHVSEGKKATITFRVLTTANAANVPPIDVNVYDVSGEGLGVSPSSWTSKVIGDGGFSASTMHHAYKKHVVLMVYAGTLANGWTPDTSYIVNGVSFGHDHVVSGDLDGVITYQLDKVNVGTGSTFATLAGMYAGWVK